MRNATLLFILTLFCPTLLYAKIRLGDQLVCAPQGHYKLYERYANLSSEIGLEEFTSALSIFYSRHDERIEGMISDIGLSAKPGGFKLVIEYYAKSAKIIELKERMRIDSVLRLSGKYSSYTKHSEDRRFIYKSTNPDNPWFVFENKDDNKNQSANTFIAECHNVQRQNASYCRIENFINSNIRLKVRFPATDYAHGHLIFNYMKRYVNSEILRHSTDRCRNNYVIPPKKHWSQR